MKRLSLLIGTLVLVTSSCAAGESTQRKGQGTLDVRWDGPTPKIALADLITGTLPKIALADLITVTLTVEGRKGLRVNAPKQFPPDFPWVLVEMLKPQRSSLTLERESWQLVYRLAPRAPGQKIVLALPALGASTVGLMGSPLGQGPVITASALFPRRPIVLRFPDVQFRESQDPADEQTIKWDPIEFEVETTIANPNRAGLRDITAIESTPIDPPVEPFDWRWPALALTILLALTIVFGLRGFWRRRFVRTAAQLALYEWQRLIALKLPEQGRGERFITLLTLIVRQYLERQFAIPARRQTTPEFLRSLDQHKHWTAEEKQFLTAFLQQSEAVKFAKAEMSADECRHWAEAARRFLDRRTTA